MFKALATSASRTKKMFEKSEHKFFLLNIFKHYKISLLTASSTS